MYSAALSLREPRNNDTLIPQSTPCSQIFVSKYHSPILKTCLLEELAGIGKKSPLIFCIVRKQGSMQKLWGHVKRTQILA